MFLTRSRLRTLTSLAVALAIVVSTIVLSKAMGRVFRIRHADKTIVVTGSVRRRIVSDRIVWRAVHRTLHEGQVVEQRPEIEERALRAGGRHAAL